MIDILPLLLVGFGLGLIHALDADHIMAVSMLSADKIGGESRRRSVIPVLRQSTHWALGHSGVLLASGVLLFGLGVAIPPSLQKLAEMGVGVLLIALGIVWAVKFRRQKLILKAHQHGDIVHIHWHENTEQHAAHNTHKPVFVGILHGLAGSAPALALIPAIAQGQLMSALLYLVIFSLGVMLSMLVFGLGFSHVQHFLSNRYNRVFQYSQQLLALTSIVLGTLWLAQAI